MRAILDVARSIISQIKLSRPAVRELIVGAYLRLKDDHGLTQDAFAQALGLSDRTLRSWLRRPPPPKPSPIEAPPAKPRGRPRRRGRFGFDVMLPDTQFGADTSDIGAFGIALKLMAAQDIGGRDEALFDAIVVEEHEAAEHIAAIMVETLATSPGAQMLTDQGTPYLAERTKTALDELEIEHAPQREADPLGKATVERAFRTAKSIAAPLLTLTDKLAAAVPALKSASLAQAATRLVLSMLLRAYQHGARAARDAMQARGAITSEELAEAAARSRERARSEDRSVRLFLGELHTNYAINRPLEDFIRRLRRYPVIVLQNAERNFRAQVHRDDIRDRASYYAKLVRDSFENYRQARARDEAAKLAAEKRDAEIAVANAQDAAWKAEPCTQLRAALDLLAELWQPATGELLRVALPAPESWVRTALTRLAESHGVTAAADMARGVFVAFADANTKQLVPIALEVVGGVFIRQISRTLDAPALSRNDRTPLSILKRRTQEQRPLPLTHLRN